MASLPDAGDWSDSPVPPQGSGAGTGTDDIEEMEVMDGATLANNDEDSSVEVVVPPDPEEVEDPLVAILKSRKKEVGSLSDRQKYLSEFVSVGKDKLFEKEMLSSPSNTVHSLFDGLKATSKNQKQYWSSQYVAEKMVAFDALIQENDTIRKKRHDNTGRSGKKHATLPPCIGKFKAFMSKVKNRLATETAAATAANGTKKKKAVGGRKKEARNAGWCSLTGDDGVGRRPTRQTSLPCV